MQGVSKGRIAAVATVAMVAATGAASGIAQSDGSGRVIMAQFTDVSPILAGQQVKVHGVTVGEVGEPSYDAAHKVAIVPLRVDASALPVHSDATAKVAPISLLGERYVDLNTGTDSAPVLGLLDSIPVTATSRDEDLQAILDTLDDPTAASLGAMLTGLGQGFDGNGENIQKTITTLAPSLRDTDQLIKVLSDQNKLISSVVDRVQPVATAVAGPNGETLDRLVASTNGLLGTTSAKDAQLAATIDELPSTLDQAQKTLDELTSTARSTTSTLKKTRETTDDLDDLADELNDFHNAADPALHSLQRLFDDADDLLAKARPIAEELGASSVHYGRTVKSASPIVDQLTDNLGNVFGFIRNWALTTNNKDGLSHYFRAQYVVNCDQGTGVVPGGCPNFAPDPGYDRKPNEHVDEAPQAGFPPAAPEAPTAPVAAPDQAAAPDQPAAPGGLLPAAADPAASATGLTPEQEQGGVGFLLGGN